jgi:protocatechuate 3,4-dioxygenase beta subunit
MRLLIRVAVLSVLVTGCSPLTLRPGIPGPAEGTAAVPPGGRVLASVPRAPAAPGNDGTIRLCGPEEPGERLVFTGRVLDYGGRPLAKAAVIAYHADRNGLYNRRGSDTRVPRLRGVAVTDARGGFRFSTVRPGAYPDGSEPAHLHVAVLAPAHEVRHVEYWFEGDPLLTERHRSQAARGSSAVIVPLSRDRASGGAWTFRHDIRLEGN